MNISKQIIPSIQRESRICDVAISHLKARTQGFEQKHNLSSADFLRRFLNGEMGDEEDFFEWKALIESIEDWERTQKGLNELINY